MEYILSIALLVAAFMILIGCIQLDRKTGHLERIEQDIKAMYVDALRERGFAEAEHDTARRIRVNLADKMAELRREQL